MTVAVKDPGIDDRRVALGLVLGLVALLVGFYWLGVREIPQNWGCGDSEPPGNDLPAFRAGAPAIHAACTIVLLAALVVLSWRRRGDRPGAPTAIAAGLVAIAAVAAAVSPQLGAAVLLGAFYVVLLSFGSLPLAAVAGLVAGAVARRRAAPWLTATGLWLAAVVLVPGHAVVVYLRGDGPIVC